MQPRSIFKIPRHTGKTSVKNHNYNSNYLLLTPANRRLFFHNTHNHFFLANQTEELNFQYTHSSIYKVKQFLNGSPKKMEQRN